MFKALKPVFYVTTLLFLSGCGNASLDQCIETQSHLWDNNRSNDPQANKAYWKAIKQCREKHG